jgi:hypothetical protein
MELRARAQERYTGSRESGIITCVPSNDIENSNSKSNYKHWYEHNMFV